MNYAKWVKDQPTQIFIDSDGVVADFDARIIEMTGVLGHEYEEKYGSKAFWKLIEDHDDFFGSLPLMQDAMTLYNGVKHLDPIFLSGVPAGGWASPQKYRFYDMHFPGARLITCPSRDKSLYMRKPNDILVDDFIKWRHLWEGRGGIFVHHTSAQDSLRQLVELGIDVRF